MKVWIKGPKMRDIVAMVRGVSQTSADSKYDITVWWHNTGRAMGVPVFPLYAHASKPAVEVIRLSEEQLKEWHQADTAEELV